MKKIIGLILTIFILNSCKNSENTKTENNFITEKTFNKSELITQKILDLPKLQWIYHKEISERLPVKVLESEMIRKSFDLNKFGQNVRILSLNELKKEGIEDFVEFHELEFKGDSIEFRISYKIEGANSEGIFIYKNGNWEILDYSVWEN